MLNRKDTETFIATIAGDLSERQTFFAHHSAKGSKDIFGNLAETYDKLVQLNQAGFSIFMTVNKLDGSRKSENVTKVRAVFFDDDANQEIISPIETSMSVQSGRGKHGYYLVDDNFPLNKFTEIQTAIAKKLNTDTAVKDLPRLMRVAGFMHTKDLSNFKEVKVLSATDKKYSYEELITAFGIESLSVSAPQVERVALAPLDLKRFIRYANQLPTQESAENKYGGRNNTALVLVRQGLANGISHEVIYEQLELFCERSGLDLNEVKKMVTQQAVVHEQSPFSSFVGKKKQPNFNALTEKMLNGLGLYIYEENKSLLKYWRGEFYRWKTNKYVHITKDELAALLTAEILRTPELKQLFKKSWTEEIIQQMRGVGYLLSPIEAGDNLKEDSNTKDLIFLNNCVLKLNESGEFEQLTISHDYFNLYSLPFNYEPTAVAPQFMRFLNEVVPDENTRNFIQEWFGYNLAYNNSYEKFVIFVGQGANGKSVLLTVLTALLGMENVSSVPLESFDAKRTFPLACTIGKLANICDEIGNTRGAEEILKKYVSGSPIFVERKNKDGAEHTPTARLTFATNRLPSFNDHTDALWRRLIVIEMKNQLLDEKKQDNRLKNPDFWVKSGEMSGILNWALKGYMRLQSRGYFNEPNASKEAKAIYADDVNSFSEFFERFLKASEKGKIGATDLYIEYSYYAQEHKLLNEGKISLCAAIKRQFPRAVRGLHANTFNGKRQRAWTGIEWASKNLQHEILENF